MPFLIKNHLKQKYWRSKKFTTGLKAFFERKVSLFLVLKRRCPQLVREDDLRMLLDLC